MLAAASTRHFQPADGTHVGGGGVGRKCGTPVKTVAESISGPSFKQSSCEAEDEDDDDSAES